MASSDGLTASLNGSFGLPALQHIEDNAFSAFNLGVECLIGGGGVKSDTVYLTHDLHDHAKKKVVKLYLTENSSIGSNINMTFLNEVEVMTRLSHPFIMSLESAVSFPDHHAILMEFCDCGTTLTNKIGRISHDEIDEFFVQIFCGLSYMHRRNIIHRDIKPDNVMVYADNTVKIIDFDLSVILQPSWPMVFGRVGTRPYMAPEMFEEESSLGWFDGYKLDSYALGVLYWCMLFQHNLQMAVDYLDIISNFKWPSDYAAYRVILENLLCPVPVTRWNMGELRHMLTKIPWLAARFCICDL